MNVKKYAVIVAGGSGTRMKINVPKQFLMLKDKPILWYSINAFLNAYNDINIIVVLPKEHIKLGEIILQQFVNHRQQIQLTIGGVTRFESVKNGLQLIKDESVVFVHDAVRCLLDRDLIERCFECAIKNGSAIPTVTATDSIRLGEEDTLKTIDRNKVFYIQTPQTFLSNILLPAFTQPYNESFTDEATVVEASGKEIFFCEGDYANIKITRSMDLIIANSILNISSK